MRWRLPVLLSGWFAGLKALHQVNRLWYYRKASQRAKAHHKPLLVVGNPRGRHGCGDLLIDAEPAGECPVEMRAYIQRMPMFTDKQFGAVFVGHVLEHLHLVEARAALLELQRVAHYVVVVYPTVYNVLTGLVPGHRRDTLKWLWKMDADGVLEWEG